jgi:predicted DsbA family dithiol-disulfide isomerase
MADLFSPGRAAAMQQHMKVFARQFGIHDMAAPSRLPNTRRALAMAEFAREAGKLDAFRSQAMDAHWRGHRDLESTVDLLGIAKAAGLDAEAAVKAGEDPKYLSIVDATRRESHARGVSGIPTFFFGDVPVVGCQPYDTLAAAARYAGARARK